MLGRSVRTSQPQGPARVDWSNPITRGFFVAETPNGQRAAKLTKPVTGGTAFLSDGTSASHLIFPIPALTLNDFTLLMVGRGSTVNISGAGFALAGPADFNNNSQAALVFEVWNNTNNWGFDGYTIGIDRQLVSNDSQEHVVALTRVGLSGRFYLDGKLVTTFAFTSSGSISVETVKLFCKGSGNIDTAASGSYIKIYGAAARALSDAEIKSLSDNPWQIFAPDSKSLWTPAAASVSLPTLVQPSSTTSAGAWTATGAATLHAAINELVPSASEYISVNSASTTELVLAEAAYPGGVAQAAYYDAFSADSAQITVVFKQGGTQISTRTHQLTPTNTRYSTVFTPAEIAVIVSGPISVAITSS